MRQEAFAMILKQVAQGLLHCHVNGIIHRYIKVRLVLKLWKVRVACCRGFIMIISCVLRRIGLTASFLCTHMLVLKVRHSPCTCLYFLRETVTCRIKLHFSFTFPHEHTTYDSTNLKIFSSGKGEPQRLPTLALVFTTPEDAGWTESSA